MAPSGVPAGDYRAPVWLPGAHLQTVVPAVLAVREPVAYRRERWDTPDGDFVDLDRLAEPPVAPRGRVAVFHGLEGSSDSPYARALMAAARERGFDAVVVHFRGCSGELNRRPRGYHSGDSDEVDWVLRRLAADGAGRPLFAVGVSLGANVLLKWLGERGRAAEGVVTAAAGVSAPHDLHAGAVALSRGIGRFYAEHFLRSLRPKAAAMHARFPGLFDVGRVLASRDFFGFDEWFTARVHGFASAMDYWQRSSCRPFLAGITVPTLVLNALNDPFLPASALARPVDVSAAVRLEYPRTGGHVGFATGTPPGRLDWLPARVLAHFDAVVGQSPRQAIAA